MSDGGRLWQIQEDINALLREGVDVNGIDNGSASFSTLETNIKELTIAIMVGPLRSLAWRTLLLHPANNGTIIIPNGFFIAGIKTANNKKIAAMMMEIDPYWSMIRSIVREIDHAPELTGESFKFASNIIMKEAIEMTNVVTRAMEAANEDLGFNVTTGQCGSSSTTKPRKPPFGFGDDIYGGKSIKHDKEVNQDEEKG